MIGSHTKALKVLTLSLASFTLTLIVLEALLRLFFPQELFSSPHELHSSGLYVNKSEGSIKHSLGRQSAIIGFTEPHLRRTVNADSVPKDRVEVKKRALFLGDSFTFGWLLDDTNTFLSQLQRTRGDVEVLNAGTGGYGTESQLKWLRLFCKEVKPDFVAFLINFDDLERSLSQNFFKLTPNGVLEEVIPSESTKESGLTSLLRGGPGYRLISENLHLYSLFRKGVRALMPAKSHSLLESRDMAVNARLDKGATSADIDLFQALLLAQQSEAMSCGATPIFVYLGWVGLQVEESQQTLTTLALGDLIANNFFSTQGMKFADLSRDPAMMKVQSNPIAFEIPGDGHPNENGAMQISFALDRALSRLGIFDD